MVANVVTAHFGSIPVGFGLQAPTGTVLAGLVLGARDLVQDLLGKTVVLASVGVASIASYFAASPAIAMASAVAFTASELLDFAVYTPIRRSSQFGDRRWAVAVLFSGAVGAVVDTIVFLVLVFGFAAAVPFMVGQLLGKMWASLAFLGVSKVAAEL